VASGPRRRDGACEFWVVSQFDFLLGLILVAPPQTEILPEAALPRYLLPSVVSSRVGHGWLLRFVAAPCSSLGGNHDPFLYPFNDFH
jgi:hypothetical protein